MLPSIVRAVLGFLFPINVLNVRNSKGTQRGQKHAKGDIKYI